jgi:catechol 2,3-dioxygenase-like lactoylglutathione lyase family enzyme
VIKKNGLLNGQLCELWRMKLNHINLVVADVATAIELFTSYFDFELQAVKGNNIIAILKGADGFSLVLMGEKNGAPAYPDTFHIGFMVDEEHEVDDLYKRLQEANIETGRAPGKIRDSYGFYFHFDNIMVEVSTRS